MRTNPPPHVNNQTGRYGTTGTVFPSRGQLWRHHRWRRLVIPLIYVAAIALVAPVAATYLHATTSNSASASSLTAAASFSLCGPGPRINCVVDGDTIWQNGVKIRIADIDTPEVSTPQCTSEAELGHRATARMLELINLGPFQIMPYGNRDEDKYQRKLRVLERGGASLGQILVSEGLARTWDGSRHPWCG